ncbi:MAG TPA: response regulator [Desulfuromonadales bacterium]|nr:response regulator [Desulfuromonadales bacterium]
MAHILILDDEADLRFILKTFLTSEGHTIDTATDGKAGLRLVELHHYDLIITDIVMPEMDGLEFISTIRRKFPDMRIIAMSGGTAKLDKNLLLATAKLMRAGTVIDKPLDMIALKTAVNEVLAG